MSKLLELRTKKAESITAMEALLKLVEDESRDFTEDEETRYSELESGLDELDTQIKAEEVKEERAQKIEREKEELKKLKPLPTNTRIEPGDNPEWRSFGEFLHAVRTNDPNNPADKRLQESRVQQMKNGTSGGFAIPDQFRPELLMVDPQAAVIRPRATVIPAGSPPDSEISMPALDQSASQNMYGGVTIYHQGESDSITESSMTIRKIALKPNKLTGYMTASNEVLNNWDAAGALIPRMMRTAMTGAEDTDFMTGDGVNKSVGLLNLAAGIDYSRATASQIAYADVYNMMARFRQIGASPVWITSRTTYPQLVQIADASSRAIWQASAVEGMPDRLMGYPVVFADRSPALGSKGDLMLCDLSAYLIKDGSGPAVAVSEHFRFQNDEVAFRLTWHVDGQSWLNGPIALEGSTSNTVSPFVILN